MCFSPRRGMLTYYTFIASLFTIAINCTKQVDIKSDLFVNLITHCLTFPYTPMMHAELRYSTLYKSTSRKVAGSIPNGVIGIFH
jgi:hypothetical protein